MTLVIPPGDFAAYIFDCDGTIADTMPLHYRAWTRALRPYTADFTQELFYAWAGTPIDEVVKKLNEKFWLSMPVDAVVKARENFYLESLAQVEAVPEVLEHIEAQRGRLPMAVVSGSPRASVMKTLRALGLVEVFDVILGAEDYTRGKPDPEGFLRAAERLGVEASRCLVFEDARLGVEAARAAAMEVVFVPPPWQRKKTRAD